MDILHMEVTMIALFVMSGIFHLIARASGNMVDMVKTKKLAYCFAAAASALTFPLGALAWQDAFLLVGFACFAAAAERKHDTELLWVLCGFAAVALCFWVMYSSMSFGQYIFGFSLAAFDAILYAVLLMHFRPGRDRVPEAGAVSLS